MSNKDRVGTKLSQDKRNKTIANHSSLQSLYKVLDPPSGISDFGYPN